MANVLRMAQVHAIETLWRQGRPQREIARMLGISRDTVGKYVRELRKKEQNQPNLTLGKPGPETPNSGVSEESTPSKPATNPTLGSSGPDSLCKPYHEVIAGKMEEGLSAQRIYQDLVADHGFEGSYQSAKRYVRRHFGGDDLPFRRMECDPGEEAQVDFGKGALVREPGKKARRPWLFRIVLSNSRKAYAEVVWRQTTENFIRCLENAFLAWGGVPKTLVLDNLKAAVTEADWYDPELNPKIPDFARHYGTVFLPTKSYTPRHKGKIERGVGYAQDNALKARVFESLRKQNLFLLEWERNIADLRIHGTIRKQVKKQFEEVEKPTLLRLPAERFPFFQEGQRTVHRDAHVEVQRSYYSVPPEYMGRRVWVRYDAKMVRIFDRKMDLITGHVRQEPGRFSTEQAHISSRKISRVERGAEFLLAQTRRMGQKALLWGKAVLAERGIEGVRVLNGLLSLASKYPAEAIDRACDLALSHGSYRLKTLRRLLAEPRRQENFEFMQEHPLIRNLDEYGRFIKVKLRKENE